MYEKIYKYLNELNIDAYLVYDFRGSNFVGRQVMNFDAHTTRRWVSIFRKEGKVTHIVPIIEKSIFEVEGEKHYYGSYQKFNELLKEFTKDLKTVVLEYSDSNDIPVQDIVPSGFFHLLKSVSPHLELQSSANFTQYISALWGEEGLKSHREATNDLTQIKDLTFEMISKAMKDGKKLTDFDVREFIVDEYHKRDLYAEEDICIASTNERTGNPHYWPTKEKNYPIEKNSIFLIDIWAKKKTPNAVYSDSTFMAWIGPDSVNPKVQEVWDIVSKARDLGIEKVMNDIDDDLRGFQVDRVVRDHIIEKGYGDYFVHRTGHSIDVNDHGSGADMDDFEKHDIRKILPDSGFSIEPGIYLPEFGIRSEVNMYVDKDGKPEVSTFKQEKLDVL